MYRILKRRLRIPSQFRAIGRSVSSYATIALKRLKFMRRQSLTPDSRGRNKRATVSTRARGRKARYTLSTTSSNCPHKSPYGTSKKCRHNELAIDHTIDKDGDVNMDMGALGIPPTFSPLPLSFSQVPSTPRSSAPRTPSIPQSSGSSFSQGYGNSPCPPNNAGAPIPDYSGGMEGVVYTSDRRPRGVQPAAAAAAPRAPKNGVLSFRMQPAAAQPTAVPQSAPRPAPAAQSAPALQPTPMPPAQPSQPRGRGSPPTAAQPPAVPVTKDAAVSAPVWVTNDPAQAMKAPSWSWSVTTVACWESVKTLPHLPPGKQIWNAAASAAIWAINDPAQVFEAPSWPKNIASGWTKIETLRQPIPGAQPWDAAPFGSDWVTNDPAQVFKAPSWDVSIAPLWTKIKTLRQPIPGAQPWDAVPFGSAWVTNDPAQVFTAPSWDTAVAPLWKKIQTLRQPISGTQLWDAAAFSCFWVTNDPAQVFTAPTWDAAIAPLWTKIQTLRQPIPGTQPWDAAAFTCVWVTNDPAQVFTAPSWDVAIAPLWAIIQTLPQLPHGLQVWGLVGSNQFMNNQPTVPSVRPAKAIAEGPPFDVSMQALVGHLTACHASEPDTSAWSEPSVFGQYIEDKSKGKTFQARLAELVTETNTRPPASDINDLNSVELQQGTQEPAISQSSNDLPTIETNVSSNEVSEAMVLEHPSEIMDTQEESAGTQHIEQTQNTPQNVAATDVQTENGSADDAMETEESQPADKGQSVAVQGESNLTASTFQFDGVPQLLAAVNNPFINAPTFPTSNAPATFEQPGGQAPLFTAPNTGRAAEQEQPYEIGGDDDPNVDHDFDFGKHFRRAPRSSAATYLSALGASNSLTGNPAEDLPLAELSPPTATSSPIEAPSSADTSTPDDASTSSMEITPVEVSPPASTPPTEASPTAQEIPPDEMSSPTEVAPLSEVPPLAPTPPAGPTAQAPDPIPAAPIPFSVPPRGERKRIRDSETECMYDKDCAHTHKWVIFGGRPVRMLKLYQQHLRENLRDAHGRPLDAGPDGYNLVAQQKMRIKTVVAHIKAHPNTTYDEKYAMDMMNDMFYEILPRVISNFLFREPEWSEEDREEEAKFLVDSMLEDELNEDSFDMVAGAYEPRFGHKFALCRENLYELFFSDWFLKFISVKLPNLALAMEKGAIRALRNPVQDALWKYFAGHPPAGRP